MGRKSKLGRQKKSGQNAGYIAERRRERNKISDLKRHIKNFPNDLQASESLILISKNQSGIKGKRRYIWKFKDDTNLKKGNMSFAFRALLNS